MNGLPPAARPASGFNFTARMKRLCSDIAQRSPEMAHVQVDRIAFSFAQCRKSVSHGLQATLTPMRFEGGRRVGWENGQKYTVQRLLNKQDVEMLYILTFYLPRFQELSFDDKLVTIFHELWHIHPEFNGDLRRHPGRCYMHTESEEEYDKQMGVFAQRWLALAPDERLFGFLKLDFKQLEACYGPVYGQQIAHPQLIPLMD